VSRCDAELCDHWTGQGCACEVLGIDRDAKLIDPDCKAGKYRSCVGGLCECACHWDTHTEESTDE
jgi:hypothetical protein